MAEAATNATLEEEEEEEEEEEAEDDEEDGKNEGGMIKITAEISDIVNKIRTIVKLFRHSPTKNNLPGFMVNDSSSRHLLLSALSFL